MVSFLDKVLILGKVAVLVKSTLKLSASNTNCKIFGDMKNISITEIYTFVIIIIAIIYSFTNNGAFLISLKLLVYRLYNYKV